MITLADVDGNSIPNNGISDRLFVAGHVGLSIGLVGFRRRDANTHASLLDLAAARVVRSRRSGEVSCSEKPCVSCPSGRQTGDTDGDCLFDVRDVTFQREYLNAIIIDSVLANAGLLQTQLSNIDADQNGEANSQDVDFLLKVNFGLYHFVRNVSVAFFNVSINGSCGFNISAVVFGGGGGGGDVASDPSLTFVYFDLESISPIGLNLQQAFVYVGSSTGVQKGQGYSGSLYKAVWLRENVYGVSLGFGSLPTRVGVSVVQGTLSPALQGSNARTAPLMTGLPTPPFAFTGVASFALVVNDITTVAVVTNGYNPFVIVNRTLSCDRELELGSTTSFVSTATTTRGTEPTATATSTGTTSTTRITGPTVTTTPSTVPTPTSTSIAGSTLTSTTNRISEAPSTSTPNIAPTPTPDPH